MKKVLLIGSKGFVGSNFKKHLLENNYPTDLIFEIEGKEELDITNFDKLNNFLQKTKPEIIVNTAAFVGGILVLVFMWLSYGLFGIFANVALILNIILVMALLSILGATLTLPGIAGIVLTIGMAVDANVLVFERIKEEINKNSSIYNAIKIGYEKALSSIVDANVTTMIAAIILFFFGSGPIKGFSVTLGLGIITSVFTALLITRLFIDLYMLFNKPKFLRV